MNENFEVFPRRHREGLISAISAGFFFVLVGAIFLATPNLFERIIDFFTSFDIVRVPNLGDVFFPAPVQPVAHSVVYIAVERFSLVWGFFQIVILALRFVALSPWNKKAESVSNLVFWFGTGFLIRTFLIETMSLALLTNPLARWFVFWSGIIMLMGVSLIVRAIILAAMSTRYVT